MRVLLLINAALERNQEPSSEAAETPRKDYFSLQAALNADVTHLGSLRAGRWVRLLCRLVGDSATQALLAWFASGRYDTIFADRETTGFTLAALLRLRKRRPRLVVIGHLLSPPKKRLLVRALGLRTTIDSLIVHSSRQQQVAQHELGFHQSQVALVPYQCDQRYWRPLDVPMKKQICSVGLEYRDYDTLAKAVDGMDLQVIVAAASHWSKHQGMSTDGLPPNVHVSSFDYRALRQLYAESLFVVVPLREVDNQAGITVILEAMAMGKAVIVSHTRGQSDVVRDRRCRNRADVSRNTQPDWVIRLSSDGNALKAQTGIYVMPGDVGELQRAIAFLISHPELAAKMGANGRRVVESTMGLDQFTARVASLIRGERLATDEVPPALYMPHPGRP